MESRAHVLGLLACLAACVQAFGGEPERSRVEVRFPARAVIGLPLPFRFVVHGEAIVAAGRLMGKTNPFALDLRSDEATLSFPARHHIEVRLPPRPYHRPGPEVVNLPCKRTRIDMGESCEFVVDLSLLDRRGRPGIGTDGARPGDYAVEFREPGFDFECARASVRLVEPNAEEKKLLRKLSLANSRSASSPPKWMTFVEKGKEILANVDVGSLSVSGRRQLGFVLLLAGFVGSRRPVGELSVQPKHLEDLLPGYRNEVLLVRYEIELARGDAAAAGKTRAAIAAERPQAATLLDYVRERGGRIARGRRANLGAAPARGGNGPAGR